MTRRSIPCAARARSQRSQRPSRVPGIRTSRRSISPSPTEGAPTAHDASAEDTFHLVIPSLPGYGFSGKPTTPGWNPPRIARAWATLMQRLGYMQYVAQGGDWGNAVTENMALQIGRAHV